MNTEPETYLLADTYNGLVEALVSITIDRPLFTDLESAIRLVLGEHGGVWPASVREEGSLTSK